MYRFSEKAERCHLSKGNLELCAGFDTIGMQLHAQQVP